LRYPPLFLALGPNIKAYPYFWPNMHAEETVIVINVDFTADEMSGFPQQVSDIKTILASSGILHSEDDFPQQALPDDPLALHTSLLAQSALLFQRKAGHRVDLCSVAPSHDQSGYLAVLEYDHLDVGITAVKLAYELISGKRKLLAEPFRLFKQFARDKVLPLDTSAIIKAASNRNIPYLQLERYPLKRKDFDDLTGGECIRANGLLLLGHGKHQRVLDGTFCRDQSNTLEGLLSDKAQRQVLLKNLHIDVILPDDSMIPNASKYHLVAVNEQVTAVVNSTDRVLTPIDNVHPTLIDIALSINREVGFAPVVINLLTSDISHPLTESKGGVMDFELGPDLGQLMTGHALGDSSLLEITADALLDWLFPDDTNPRMPVIAITGTNGKTTTTRLIHHVLKEAGYKPGMVCTDGIFLNEEKIVNGDQCQDTGHLKILTSNKVDAAVLEAHHRGLKYRGLAFRWCDIAVCLNVSDDHLGKLKINTVEQMAEVKADLPRRARQAVVLNADDEHCMAMINAITAKKICLVSMVLNEEILAGYLINRLACFCVLENIKGEEWLVIHDQEQRLTVMTTSSIPITIEGQARFNVSNAMHTVAACYLNGVSIDVIRSAMGSFRAGYESTPGRLNIFDQLPFRVIMDFAHNPDGYQKLCEFVDQQHVTGRKVVAFAGTGTRPEETLKKMAASLAGHFDFYFCKEHVRRDKDGEDRRKPVAHIMRQGLLEAGVTDTQIAVRTKGKEVVFEIFDSCAPGDLLVLITSYVEMHQVPGYITEYAEQMGELM